MKSSCNKEDTVKKYASSSIADTARSTKTSVGANQYVQPWQQQRKTVESARLNVPIDKSGKTISKENFIPHHSIQPCPFTFLTAVKRKLALSGNHSACKKTYEPDRAEKVPEGTMDFIKPLKVPDLKISPKADYSSRESLLSNEELSKKIEAVQRDEMALKCTDRVPRKLEFSSSSATSMLNYENIEPLKIPDVSISKKKDISRDSSREKENRSKRVKKDDPNMMKNNDDLEKWSKSHRHISRREIADSIVNRKLKNDRILAHGPKDTDVILKKPKSRNVVTSTVRKDDEKRLKYSNIPATKPKKEKILESKNRTSSSESLYPLDKGTRLHEKILIREGYKAMISEIGDKKYKDDSQITNSSKQSEDQKYKSHSDTRLQKHQSKSNSVKLIETLTQNRSKGASDKQKSLSKTDSKHSSEISEDLTTAVNSIASLVKSQSLVTEVQSSVPSKNKEVEKPQSSNRNTEDPKYSDNFSHVASSNTMSNSSIIETNLSQDTSLSDKLMDPMRISFRDESYSNQPEYAELKTPDINLMIRSKRRKQTLQARDNDNNDYKESKSGPSKSSQEIEEAQLMHLKAEMNLLDSFSESLRQVIDVERSRLSNDDLKKQSVSLQTDYKNIESSNIESESFDSKEDDRNKIQKTTVKVVEVQTQTVNDIATQTEMMLCQRGVNTSLEYSRISIDPDNIPHLSLNSEDRYENMDRVENISLPSKIRTMSEISLHETTSSIKTETGTEISISTRDVTCSFNKYLDLEMAQLIKDERQRYDKIEMLFKSREKTLNDRTKKLVKLEEQKRALRDTGQDSRISSVKKKQRALLLKLQQEKDEMNRLKELHKIASQERKLMLQKQRDMFNPEMSTKNILNKLKRSADTQSPRRLSGPMKGYDIRSNSSISSLVDSDKSQFDRSQLDFKLNLSDITPQRNDQMCSRLELDSSLKQGLHGADNIDKKLSKLEVNKQQKEAAAAKLKYDLKARKFEEKMPKADLLKLRAHQYDLDALLKHGASAMSLMNNDCRESLTHDDDDKSVSEYVKSESDALIEEFTQMWKSQFPDLHPESLNLLDTPESLDALKQIHRASTSRRLDKESIKKLQQQLATADNKGAKRKVIKNQKPKPSQVVESTSKSEDSHYLDEAFRPDTAKRSKLDNSGQQSDENYQNSILEELDLNESQSSLRALLRHSSLLKERNQQLLRDIANERENTAAAVDNSESPLSQKEDEENTRAGNTSARSQLSLTISHQSSNDSDRSYTRSVVIRAQQDHHHSQHSGLKTSKKLEQILKAREATLVSRRNCVEEWIAWHARLREEESRVARMEQAAYKLVSATAKALSSHNDTTVSSDTSDVEGRIELLTQKLADRRLEMARLKKEARKQAKQRLRALEANLLNQIKKYDATILDMRKKLESRRASSKETEKLAIESKSVVDFKVPEIPIKKIQEIYKSSDLLRSKSDSDIISTRSQGKNEKSKDDKARSSAAEKDSSRSKNTTESKILSSPYTVYDDDHESSEKSDYSAAHSHKTKSNSEEITTQKSVATEMQEMKRSSSQSSNISEEIPSEAYSVKSQTEQIQTAQTLEASSSQYISEKIEHGTSAGLSRRDLKESSVVDEELTPGSDETSLIFSRKLDHIQLHNKELNDDIHNLENDLKELTEMMSNFSKKSDEKTSKSIDSIEKTSKDVDKTTSREISEELPASELAVQSDNIDEDLQTRVKNILSDVIPETDNLLSSIEELDTRIKSVEIPDSVQKTISEHINKSTVTEEILALEEKDESSLGANHYQSEINSVSEIISTAVEEDKENVSPNESQSVLHKVSKSLEDAISSQIQSEYDSEFEKFSSVHIQEDQSDESMTLKKTAEISVEHISSKIDEHNDTEDQIYTATDDKIIDTKISATEDISANHIVSSQIVEELSIDQVASSKINENISTEQNVISKIINDSIADKVIDSKIGDQNSAEKLSLKNTDENSINEVKNNDAEEHSVNQSVSLKIMEEATADKTNEIIFNKIPTATEGKFIESKISTAEEVNEALFKENNETEISIAKTESDNDWTLSDSFEVQPIYDKDSKSVDLELHHVSDYHDNRDEDRTGISDMEDSAMFLPRGESTNLQETFALKVDESSEPRIGIRSDEFNDILEIIERETKNDDERTLAAAPEPAILNVEGQKLPKIDVKIDSPIECDVSVTIRAADEESESIEEEIENRNDTSISENLLNEKSVAEDDQDLPQIEIGVKIQLVDEEDEKSKEEDESKSTSPMKDDKVETFEAGEDRVSSDGEQLDNLIEVAEGKLDTVEKLTPPKKESTTEERVEKEPAIEKQKTRITVLLDRTFEVIKDPEYEDISEESLEVSEILDKSGSRISQKSKKFSTIPEKYVIKSKSDEVLRILDEIAGRSSCSQKEELQEDRKSNDVKTASSSLFNEKPIAPPPSPEKLNDTENVEQKEVNVSTPKANSLLKVSEDEVPAEDAKPTFEDENAEEKHEDKIASESSGGMDTPRGVSEIDMDSPRDGNEDSRLDIDALDDDLLSGNSLLLRNAQPGDGKTEFRTTPMGVTSEKDIEAMIDKLKASLEQPGLEVAELEAKLLQIENLQIELEIKKLEAEEESYYVREIPNKPPPPYTPPGVVRMTSTHGSPSPPPAVVPTNVEELTAITEKATAFIYRSKQTSEDILALEAPLEIYELAKDNNNDTLKKDRRIYNTFLFDLCKELIAEMYKAEYEKPGPSWTKPSVKTKPAVKIARTLDELNDFVSKEVATLFGFKTKLQRENMVMRWSRKRRDRVDELLAKEAQAEEKEWTKFHHDELAVKNELTMTILDTLILETTNCVKAAYAKKRKVVQD